MYTTSAAVLVVVVNKPSVSGGNGTIPVTVSPDTSTSSPAEGTTPLVPTYPLPPGGKSCFIFLICQDSVLIVQSTLVVFTSL